MNMEWHHLVSYFFGGILMANAVPHFVSGAMGESFQTPFANPPGQGLSSSTINILWSVVNLVVGYVLLSRVGDFEWKIAADAAAFGLGILAMGLFHARHFGRLHGGNAPKRS